MSSQQQVQQKQNKCNWQDKSVMQQIKDKKEKEK
jgi:hypothetical protein